MPGLQNLKRALQRRILSPNLTRQAYILLTLTTLFWGGNSVAGKMASGEISPMLLTLARWVVAALIVFAFALPDVRRDWPARSFRAKRRQ